uniref:Neuropeptide n=1 Tax=Ambigolimax valentianus TaxID=1338344 RepID=E3WH51_9EUPU|nr:neuropeptide precursor [Ambigolimax valentianus]
MNHLTLCAVAVVAISCLVQLVTPVPLVIDGVLDYDANLPLTDDILEMKEMKDIYDPSLLMNRFRRNVAQWSVGSHHFNDYNHEGASRRYSHRRFNNRQGGGQIVDA